jgi:hypothetical protein
MLLYRLAAFLLFAAAACSIHLVMHARHAYTITAELHPQQPRHRRVGTSKSTTSGGRSCHKLQLGFDYPELRPLKQHLATLLCEPPTAADIQAAYASILGLHTPCHGSNSANPATHLASFLTAAQQLLAPHSLRRCGWDPSLLEALQLNRCEQKTRHPMGPHATNFTAQEQDDNNSRSAGLTNTTTSNQAAGLAPRVLLAANLHNSGHMLPNFVAQTLQLALLLPPGGLGVSLYESGSSDLTRFWITLLHLLLLPLGTPHYFVTGGSLRPTQGLPRIQLMAALRNAALEPVVSPPHLSSTSSHEGGSSSSSEAGWLPGFHQHGRKQRGAGTTHRHPPRRTSQQVLSHGMDGFLPDTIAFSNDVFLCAGDVLRLAAHRADLSCGMDFYVGPWEAGPGAQWTSAHPLDPQQQQQQQEEEEEEEEEAGPGLHRAPTHSVNTQQQQQKQQQEEEEEEPGVGSGGAGSSGVGPVGAVAPAPQQLRFYDKVRCAWCCNWTQHQTAVHRNTLYMRRHSRLPRAARPACGVQPLCTPGSSWPYATSPSCHVCLRCLRATIPSCPQQCLLSWIPGRVPPVLGPPVQVISFLHVITHTCTCPPCVCCSGWLGTSAGACCPTHRPTYYTSPHCSSSHRGCLCPCTAAGMG